MANYRSGLTDAIRALLREQGAQTVAEVAAAMIAAGLADAEKNVRSILSQRQAAKEFETERRDGRVYYSLNPTYVPPFKGEGARLSRAMAEADPVPASIRSPMSVAPPVPGVFGITCRAPLAPKGCKGLDPADTVQAAIADCLSADTGQTLAEIVDLLDGEWSKAEIVAALGEMVINGAALPAPAEHGGTFYTLPVEAALEETRGTSETPDARRKAEQLGVQASGEAPRESRAASTGAAVIGLGTRLEAIADDLDAALQAACDALLPHALIKALVQAQSGALRALRQMEA